MVAQEAKLEIANETQRRLAIVRLWDESYSDEEKLQ